MARAIAAAPDLLICDEVTPALDVSVQAVVLDLLADLRRRLGLAVLLSTHDLGVVASVVDRVLVLERGAVREEGPVDQILSAPSHHYTRALIAAAPSLPEVKTTGRNRPSADERAARHPTTRLRRPTNGPGGAVSLCGPGSLPGGLSGHRQREAPGGKAGRVHPHAEDPAGHGLGIPLIRGELVGCGRDVEIPQVAAAERAACDLSHRPLDDNVGGPVGQAAFDRPSVQVRHPDRALAVDCRPGWHG